jgi:hypothetical protein
VTLTWRGKAVALTWQARLSAPHKAWSAQFMDQVQRSDAAGEDLTALTARIELLAAEVGAFPELQVDPSRAGLLSVRLLAPTIAYLPGSGPRRIGRSWDVVYVGGPMAGERHHVEAMPLVMVLDDGSYRRDVHCAIDDAVRYVWLEGSH